MVRFLIALVCLFSQLAFADELVEHIGGSSWSWPGQGQAGDYLPSSAQGSLTRAIHTATSAQVSGGFDFDLSLLARYGTYVGEEAVPAAQIDQLIARHRSRIHLTPAFREVIQLVAADRRVFAVLSDFLAHGGELVPVAQGGHYTASPFRIETQVLADRLESGQTLFHELLHYVFDKTDSALAETHASGGADHFAILLLQERYALVRHFLSGRAGVDPVSEKVSSFYGFTRRGKAGRRLAELMNGGSGDAAGLDAYAASEDFYRAIVDSALVTPLSSRELERRMTAAGDAHASDYYRFSDAEIQDLAYLGAYEAVLARGGLRVGAAVARARSLSLGAAFGSAEFQQRFARFVAELRFSRAARPLESPRAQGDAALAAALK